MTTFLQRAGRIAVTLVLVAVAGTVAWQLWVYYMEDPWTRDARVRAEVIGVAPDVPGLVAEVLVRDNQPVHRGDVLFRVDRARYDLALAQAKALVESSTANWQRAKADAERYQRLDQKEAASQQQKELAVADAAVAEATLHQAEANRDLAALNLDRTEIRAPADGSVTNLRLQPGDYVGAGTAVIALVNSATLHLDGYFEETKLARIRPGDPVRIHLMGEDRMVRGHVDSIDGGIADRERSDANGQLANVNPTFSWVRLAQRVPVRIAIDSVPEGLQLIPGRTATVSVETEVPQRLACDARAADGPCVHPIGTWGQLKAWLLKTTSA